MLIWNHLEFCIISSKNFSFVYSFVRIIILLQTFEQIKISFLEKSYSVYVRNCYQTQLIANLQVKYVNEKCFNLVLIFGFFSASNVDTLFIIYIYQNDFKHAHGKLHKHNQIFLEPRFTPHKPKCRAEI